MTIRDYLNRKKKKYFIATFICWGVFMINLIVAAVSGMAAIFYATLLLSLIAGQLFLLLPYWMVRCPSCNNRVGFTFYIFSKKVFSVPGNMGFCLYCGTSIDSETKKI